MQAFLKNLFIAVLTNKKIHCIILSSFLKEIFEKGGQLHMKNLLKLIALIIIYLIMGNDKD